MALPFIPFIPLCFQCGTNQNPCRCKVVGPTLGFFTTIVAAVVCYPASLFCGCCFTKTGKDMLGYPVTLNGIVSDAIPI
ncbi:polyol transporter 2 [Aspergillus fumigatus]